MSAPEYVVPPVLRGGQFVPRQSPGRREPARVTAGAFTAAGLPVPENPAQRNIYQLTERQGVAWSLQVDEHVRRRGAELLGHGALVLVDLDVAMAVDGTPMVDTLRWLSDRAVEAGELLDLSVSLTVRTPGHRDSGHLPGWHLWFKSPAGPVRMGPLARCRSVELRSRGTCPGSPGYGVRYAPDELSVLPRWIAELAGAPSKPVAVGQGSGQGNTRNRLEGILGTLTDAGPGDHRNRLLYWAACRCSEMIADGDLGATTAERVLYRAAEDNGHVAKHGPAATLATIRSGLRTAVAA